VEFSLVACLNKTSANSDNDRVNPGKKDPYPNNSALVASGKDPLFYLRPHLKGSISKDDIRLRF
jgi:hypothetical protein